MEIPTGKKVFHAEKKRHWRAPAVSCWQSPFPKSGTGLVCTQMMDSFVSVFMMRFVHILTNFVANVVQIVSFGVF